MKVIRSYAKPENAVNIQNMIQQLVELELEKLVNNKKVSSPTSHDNNSLGGECA